MCDIIKSCLLVIIICLKLLIVSPIYGTEPSSDEIDKLKKTYTVFKKHYENSDSNFTGIFYNISSNKEKIQEKLKELDCYKDYFNNQIKGLRDKKVPVNAAFIDFLQEYISFFIDYNSLNIDGVTMLEVYLNHPKKHELFEYVTAKQSEAGYDQALKNAKVIGNA